MQDTIVYSIPMINARISHYLCLRETLDAYSAFTCELLGFSQSHYENNCVVTRITGAIVLFMIMNLFQVGIPLLVKIRVCH